MIKVGICIAYDWSYLKTAIPLIYNDADLICLSIDVDRKSWVGNPFTFDEKGFKELITQLDTQKKIQIYEDNFYVAANTPMQNEVRQRNLMGEKMGKGGWHIQIDADEYFFDFPGFANYLKALTPQRSINVCCPFITLYKQIPEGFLMIEPQKFEDIEFIPIATNVPHYEYGRRNGHFNHFVSFPVLHQSWARTPEEVWQKLSNWGHRFDSSIQKQYEQWQEASIDNYKSYRDFNQVIPSAWPKLELLPAKDGDIQSLIKTGVKVAVPISPLALKMKNSIWVSRCKKVMNIIRGKFTSAK